MGSTQTTNQPDDGIFRFRDQFRRLTKHPPMPWQERLFQEHFVKNDLPEVIDLPTGLGKTMVMAIWLIARAVNPSLPRRLVYVVDRRTVVDQATDLARSLQKTVPQVFPCMADLAISTLRGQLADNRGWTRDPSRPAIIIGTVDMIGSRLLFSGYRSSYKQRPLDAGLLSQDSLLVLDEAHLSRPFEKLLKSIADFQDGQGLPMRVIRMSATSGDDNGTNCLKVFRLKADDLMPDRATGKERNQTITRFGAIKCLTIATPVESTQLNRALANAAVELAEDKELVGKRIVVFVRSPDDAKAIAGIIRDHKSAQKANATPPAPYANSVEVLTGTMRNLERDELVGKDVFQKRWLNVRLDPVDESNKQPVFLISTSAGEVGFDLNADHLVSDQTTIDSFIQRLGRVNRRGAGNAKVILVPKAARRGGKEGESRKHDQLAQAMAITLDLLTGQMHPLTEQMDVSPKAIDMLKKGVWKDRYNAACAPPPTMLELTDILLDAWSMTSITQRMPGRPEVGPWLRGIAEEMPQTTIAWRAELDLPGFDQLDLEDIEEWLDTHAIRTHEALSVPTSVAAKWFVDRWKNLDDARKKVVAGCPVIVDRAGLRLISVQEFFKQLARKNMDSLLNAELVLPASFGGIERGVGLLDPSAPQEPVEVADAGDMARKQSASTDVADERGRYRELITRNDDGVSETRPIGSGARPADSSRFTLELESTDEACARLISYVPKRDKPEWGSQRQTLSMHVGLVRKRLDEILGRLDLPEPSRRAAELAAEYHDHGKNRERWQRTVNGEATPPGERWTDRTIGKSGGVMKRDIRRYRHEFGSVRELIDAHQGVTFTDSNGADITREVIDLALHIIAAHHGRGRPDFPKGGFDPDAERRSGEIHADVIRRFGRLQRQYGWWRLAWLENLLRCADGLASADDVSEDDVGEASQETGEDS